MANTEKINIPTGNDQTVNVRPIGFSLRDIYALAQQGYAVEGHYPDVEEIVAFDLDPNTGKYIKQIIPVQPAIYKYGDRASSYTVFKNGANGNGKM